MEHGYEDIRRNAQKYYNEMPIAERQCLVEMLLQEYVLSTPYYSKVMFVALRVGGPGAGTYRVANGVEARAFSYAFATGTAITAGFPAAFVASRAETNIAEAQKTNAGESVEIFGLAIQPIPGVVRDIGANVFESDQLSDARMLAVLDDAISVSLQLNAGREGYWFGNISMLPGSGGLEGAGYDSLGEQAIPGDRPQFGFMTNGRPMNDNYFRMPEGVVWLPAGQRDSLLSVRLRLERAAVVFSGGDLANIAGDEAGAAGIRGYTYPAQVACSLMIYTHGKVFSKRSLVS